MGRCFGEHGLHAGVEGRFPAEDATRQLHAAVPGESHRGRGGEGDRTSGGILRREVASDLAYEVAPGFAHEVASDLARKAVLVPGRQSLPNPPPQLDHGQSPSDLDPVHPPVTLEVAFVQEGRQRQDLMQRQLAQAEGFFRVGTAFQ